MVAYPTSSPASCRRGNGFFDFRPLPLLSNPHVQTLLGHLLRGRRKFSATREHILRLPDNDALVLHDAVPLSLGDVLHVGSPHDPV